MALRSGPGCIDGNTQRIQIGHRFDGHDMLAPHAVDQQIARRGEQKALGIVGNLALRRFEHAHIDFLPQIGDVALVAPIVTQILHQDRLQRQNLADEPSRDGIGFHSYDFAPIAATLKTEHA